MRYAVELESIEGFGADPLTRLRRACKALRRAYGFRVVAVAQDSGNHPGTTAGTGSGAVPERFRPDSRSGTTGTGSAPLREGGAGTVATAEPDQPTGSHRGRRSTRSAGAGEGAA